MTKKDITIIAAGDINGEPVVLVERRFGAFAAVHYSGGDDIVAADIRAGLATYWTVIFERTYATACSGKRWRTQLRAKRWLAAEREWLRLEQSRPGITRTCDR